MKKYQFIVLVLLALVSLSFAQEKNRNGSSVVNIKENAEKELNALSETKKSNVYRVVKNNQSKSEAIITKSEFVKLFLFVEGSILILLIVYSKRRKKENEKHSLQILKENIRRLRNERIGSIIDNSLIKTRRKLVLQPVKANGADITSQAKRLSISKGEVHLAAKLNFLMNSTK